MKGQSAEEKKRILAIAGNPANGQVQPLKSVRNGYRILQRQYQYSPEQKRTGSTKKVVGVVIDDGFLTVEQYHQQYTRRGKPRWITSTPRQQKRMTVSRDDEYDRKPDYVCERMMGAAPILYRTAVNIGLVDDLRAAYGNPLADEILSLAFHRIIDRDNAARRYKRFATTFALPFPGAPSEQELADLYAALGTDDQSLSQLFAARCARLPDGARVNYDSTSIPTAGADIYVRKISKMKEGTFGPMMHLSLLADQESGQPLLYRLFAGNTPDSSTVEELLHRMEEFVAPGKQLCLVADRGYETMSNLLACAAAGKGTLMAVRDLRQGFVQEAMDAYSDFWDAATCLPGTAVHGHSRKFTVPSADGERTFWVHLFRDDIKCAAETTGLMRKLDEFAAAWEKGDWSQRNALTQTKTFAFFTGNVTTGELHRNEDVVNAASHDFGFFASVSTVEMDAAEALQVYRRRDHIEKIFKSGKLNVCLDVVRAHWQDTMKGRFVVNFVTLILLAELHHQLGKAREPEDRRRKRLSPREYSLTDVLDITAGIGARYNLSTGKFRYQNTIGEVDRLCEACGTPHVYDRMPEYMDPKAVSR